MSITTLEDVFLNINREFDEKDDINQIVVEEKNQDLLDPYKNYPKGMVSKDFNPKVANDTTNTSRNNSMSRFSTLYKSSEIEAEMSSSAERLISNSSTCSNIYALFQKRFNLYKRDRTGLICEIFVPSLMVLMGSASTLITWYSYGD